MPTFRLRTLLVAIADPFQRSNKAVRRAGELAHKTGARLEFLHAIPPLGVGYGPMQAQASAALLEAASAQNFAELERLARPLRREELLVNTTVLTGYAPHEAILRHARATGADLIIIEARKHNQFARMLLRQTDYELMRHADIPLLIVKGSTHWRSPRILAAVDPFHSHDKPASLDGKIVLAGRSLARALDGTLHLAHVWWPLAEMLPGVISESAGLAVTPAQNRAYQKAIRRYFHQAVRKYHIRESRQHLRRGDPGLELPSLARSVKASVVVMGAVSRSGLKRLFIGHTAERVLDSLRCDALIVTPQGFRA
ncbi:MAG TPA: universal stress protein [Steroidobacteraceae bacterium]|nr:universal stress protein [Steroidobacteraceae bacterium]